MRAGIGHTDLHHRRGRARRRSGCAVPRRRGDRTPAHGGYRDRRQDRAQRAGVELRKRQRRCPAYRGRRQAEASVGIRSTYGIEHQQRAPERTTRALDQPGPGQSVRLCRRSRARQGVDLSFRRRQRIARGRRAAVCHCRARCRAAPLCVPSVGPLCLRHQRTEHHADGVPQRSRARHADRSERRHDRAFARRSVRARPPGS